MQSHTLPQDYGDKIKSIRVNLGYSRERVSALTGINRDTIRRIEKNETIPKIETLELLSSCYRVNLLSLLTHDKESLVLTQMYNDLDFMLNNPDLSSLKSELNTIKIKIDRLSSKDDSKEILQFKKYLDVLEDFYFNQTVKPSDLIDRLTDILKIENEDFTLRKYSFYNYTFVETRILFTLSTILMIDEKYSNALEILNYLNIHMKYFILDAKLLDLMQTKIYTNLATIYFLMEDDENTIDICDKGIDYCLKNDSMSNLHNLFFRKAVALHYLKNERSKIYFQNTLDLIKIKENPELLVIFKNFISKYDKSFI